MFRFLGLIIDVSVFKHSKNINVEYVPLRHTLASVIS